MKAIVLAGGGGTRLWPLSKENFPKQFLSFGMGASLLQKTVQRLKKAPFIDEVLVATNATYQKLVEEQVGTSASILVEPLRKNTAPAIALALKTLNARAKEPVLIVPSDHLIEPEAIFLQALEKLCPQDQIITFGIRPTKPETGYGYIEMGDPYDSSTFKVKRFVEKPNLEKAQIYASNPHFFWNSGMFLFTAETFWKQVALHAPELAAFAHLEEKEFVRYFDQMPDISIDYAIMEKSQDVLVCPLAITWSDVGCWDSVYEVMEKDQNQNVTIGKVLAMDTKNSLIIGNKRMISTIGLEDLLIIETEDAILISKKGESQKVKALLQALQGIKISMVLLGGVLFSQPLFSGTWQGSVSQDWNTSANWSDNTVPGSPGNSSDPAIFAAGPSILAANLSDSVTLSTIQFFAGYNISSDPSPYITLMNSSVSARIETIVSSTITAPVSVQNSSGVSFVIGANQTLTLASLQVQGSSIAGSQNSTSSFTISGGLATTSAFPLQLSVSTDSSLTVSAGTFRLSSGVGRNNGSIVYGSNLVFSEFDLSNYGTLSGTGGGGQLQLTNSSQLTNHGTLTLTGNLAIDSTSSLEERGTESMNGLTVNGGSYNNMGSATMQALAMNGGSCTNSGSLTIQNSINLNGGTFANTGMGAINVANNSTISNTNVVLSGNNSSFSQLILGSNGGGATSLSNSPIQVYVNYNTSNPYLQFQGVSVDTGTFCTCGTITPAQYGLINSANPGAPMPLTLTMSSGNSFAGKGAQSIPILYAPYGANNAGGNCSLPNPCIFQELQHAFSITIQNDADARYYLKVSDVNNSTSLNVDVAIKPHAHLTSAQQQGTAATTTRTQARQALMKGKASVSTARYFNAGLESAPDGKERYVVFNDALLAQQSLPEQLAERGRTSPETPWSVYAGPIGSFGRINRIGGHEGNKFYMGGITAGFDHIWTNQYKRNVPFGIGLGLLTEYSRMHGLVEHSLGSYMIDLAYGQLYSTVIPKKIPELSVNAILGGGYSWYHVKRKVSTGMTAKGFTTGPQADCLVGMDYNFVHARFAKIPQNVEIATFASLQYAWNQVYGYTETGAGTHDLSMQTQSVSSLWSLLGTRWSYTWYPKSWYSIRPELILGWQHDFLGEMQQIRTTLATPIPQTFISQVEGPGRNMFLAGLDFRWHYKNIFMIQLDYDVWVNHHYLASWIFLEFKGAF